MTAGRTYRIDIQRSAEREMNSLSKQNFRRVARAILSLERAPRGRNSKKLHGRHAYRLRIGPYRVLYTIDDDSKTVKIAAVRHRREAYR